VIYSKVTTQDINAYIPYRLVIHLMTSHNL